MSIIASSYTLILTFWLILNKDEVSITIMIYFHGKIDGNPYLQVSIEIELRVHKWLVKIQEIGHHWGADMGYYK